MKKLHDFKIVLMFFLLFLMGAGFIPAYSSAPCTSQGTWILPVGLTVWSFPITVVKNVVIPAGATLEINNGATIFFIDVSITVQVGGRINIYGGAVLQRSPNCPCTWPGIIVQGDRLACQTPLLPLLQGYLDMRNSTIMDANIAIDGQDGAILYCRESDFINNRIDVRMTPYSYNNFCNNGCDNISLFTLCNFIWNKPICGNPDFDIHVWLMGVYDIEFEGCQFRNDYPVIYTTANTRGIGIKADDASFDVRHWVIGSIQGHWTGCGNNAWSECHQGGIRSLFCGLQIGIQAIWSAAGHINTCDPTRVHYAIFNDNNYSILTTDESLFTTSWSNFYYNTTTAYFTIRPINFINCKVDKILASTHSIFNNSFRTNERSTQHVVMAGATNANHYSIYRNQFRNANGNPQQGIGVHLIGDQLTGNYVECNTFLALNNDIYINGGLGGDMTGGTVCHPFLPQPRCIVLPQGQIISAGNVFSVCGISIYNIVNNSGNAVNYYWPAFPNCINDISGTTTPIQAQLNLCELPCGSCTYEFDYDEDPPLCGQGHGHRLGTESVNSSSVHSEISVYPNPANNHFSISFGKIEMPCTISIYDMKGQLVKTFEATESITDINTDNYLPGVYVIKIQNSSIGINEIQKIQIIK